MSDATATDNVASPPVEALNPMAQRSQTTLQELRTAITCLPRTTRLAMLRGIDSNDIVVGAYTHEHGICPMLAAHRAGGRTDFISFARAWDRFAFSHARGRRARGARRATERELLILRTHLEASLLEDDGPAADLRAAIKEHRELAARREQAAPAPQRARPAAASARPGDPDRSRELRSRPGWSWMRIFRRLDDYERALARVHAAERDATGGVQPAEHRERALS